MTSYFTGKGDDGSTGLLGGERISKADPRPRAYGAVDEASAALGLARALSSSNEVTEITIGVQRDLYGLMAELAAEPEHAERFRSIDTSRVEWLEAEIERIGAQVEMPKEFVIGGDSVAGAAFDLARAIVRRAERRVVGLDAAGAISNPALLAYLNRLSSLCFLLALFENQQAGVDRPSLAKHGGG